MESRKDDGAAGKGLMQVVSKESILESLILQNQPLLPIESI